MKVSGRFGPIPIQTVLNANGNGTVEFQVNGNNARITNLMVKVDTSNAQAVCTLYLGQVADANILGNTNSGSTGAPMSGNIDLFDGQILYVVWTGGDPGATATATFVGVTIPFEQVGTSDVEWDNPIAAGDGSLIYPALKSPNYIPGLTGWRIDREGNVEFNDAVIRGTVVAGNGNVILDAEGIHVQQPDGELTEITTTNGLIVYNNDQTSWIRIDVTDAEHPYIQFMPIPTEIPGEVYEFADIRADYTSSGGEERPYLQFRSPNFFGRTDAEFILYGERSNGDAPLATFDCDLQVDGSFRGSSLITGDSNDTASAAIGTTETVVLTSPSVEFRANRAYAITSTCRYVLSAATAQFPVPRFRKTNLAGQLLADTGRWDMPASGLSIMKTVNCIFTVGATSVTAPIVMTLQTPTAAPTITQNASAGNPRSFYIYDIGDAADYPDHTQMT